MRWSARGERGADSSRHPACERRGEAHPRRKLLSDILREDCHLTGTHVGCEHGVCGACTVLVDGQPARSCLISPCNAMGRDITTVESLAGGEGLKPVQQAFHDCHGLQCGFCTPGMLMTLTEFLRDHPDPSEAQVRDVLSGNLCRCTGYQTIVAGDPPSGREGGEQAGE